MGVSFAALSSGTALATADTWYGNSSVNWSDTGNWVGGAVPTTGQDVTILPGSNGATNNFAPNNLDQSFTLNSLTLGATTNTTDAASGYNIATTNSSTLAFQSGGYINDVSGNTGTDQINVGVTFNGPGTVSAGNNSSLSFGQAVSLNGALGITTSSGSSLVFTQGLTGTGPVDVNNSGSVVFLGTSTYSGGTTITTGTLQLGNGTTSGNITTTGGTVSIASGAGLAFDEPGAMTFNQTISGMGSVTLNAGTVTLSGTNNYAGGTNIAGGELVVGASSNLGTGTIAFTNNAALQITGSGGFAQAVTLGTGGGTIDTDGNTVTLNGGVTGTGGLTLNDSVGTGTLVLTGTNSYGTTTITAGTLQIGSDTVQGSISATANIADNGALDFHNLTSPVFDYSGTISGTGSVSVDSGEVVFTGSNSYSGGTTVANNAILEIGNGLPGGTGSISSASTANIVDNGTVEFANVASGTATIAGSLMGTGTLEIGAPVAPPNPPLPATVVLTSPTNNFTGLTVINAGGLLQVGASGLPSQLGGSISNQGSIDFKNIGAGETIGGYFFGNGSVELDEGTLTLSNTAVNSSINIGGTVTINGSSTLQLGDGGNNATLVNGNITGDGTGTLTTDSANIVTLSGNISNIAAFNQNGAGTTVLTGNNTFTGTTTINAGTLQIGEGGAVGTIASTSIVDAGTLAFDRSGTVTYAGVISDGSSIGALTQMGGGTLILTGTNTYTGATNINSGTLQLGNGTTAGSISNASAVSDDGALVFDEPGSTTYGGSVTGGGSLTQMGTGTLTLSGTNSYAGPTNIASGTLAVTSNSNLGSGAINFTNTTANGATLQFLGSDTYNQAVGLGTIGGTFDTDGHTVTLGGGISGTGSLTLADSAATTGTLILTGNSNYSGGTTITTGTLQLGNGTIAGTIAGDVTDNSALVFNEGGNSTFGGMISGTGTVTQDDTSGGTLTLSNASNNYSGNTIVESGALSIAADSDLGNGGTLVLETGTTLNTTATGTYMHAVTVAGNSTFSVAAGTTATWSGQINDGASAGAVNINGGGTFAPTNASNGYTGGTVVTQGSTLTVGADGEMGAATGGVTLGDASTGGTLDANASFTTGRTITIEQGGATIISESGVTFEITKGIAGAGALTVSGPGALVLTGASTYGGGTTIAGGSTLQLGDGTHAGTVTGGITDNGTLTLNEAGNQTIANAITGQGSLVQDDTSATPGTLTLTAAEGYTGGTTITSGTLQLGNGTTAGSVIGNVSDSGTLAFDEPGSTTYGGIVSGGGGLTQSGTSTLILTGANTYTGKTTINSGTLQIGNGGTAGSISALSQVVDNGTLAFNETGALVFANAISGGGNVAQNGAGTTILTGANSYGGTTTISVGTLQVGNNGTSGTLGTNSNVTDNGTLAFDRTDTVTYGGIVSGTGNLVQMGTGTLVLTNANTYKGATTISAGTLQLGNGTTSGSVAGNITDNATLAFDESGASTTYAGVISGTGAVNQNGSGTLVLTGANTYSGLTTISSGTLQIGNGGTTGAVTGAIADNGTLAFDESGTMTVAGAITGTGAVNQIGSGTTVLTGADSTGTTTISAGTLQIGNGTNTGSVAGNIADNGTLAFDRSDSVTYGGQITGSGNVSVIGSGTTTFTGTENYGGTTTVSGGTLLVNGSIASSSATTVSSGGEIGGTGTVGKLTIGNNGTIQPGSGGLGTLTVNGTFLLGPGATYAAQVTPTSADLIKVNGTATLDGALIITPTGTGFSATSIPILTTTGGLSGTFSSVTVLGTTTEIPIVGYNADDVFLSFEPTVTSLLPTSSTNTNQSRVADAIDFALTHDNAVAFNPVTSETGTTLTQTLSELSGETAVAFQNVAVSSVASFMSTLFDPSVGGRGGLGAGIDGISDNHAMQQVAFNGANTDMPYTRPSLRAITVWTDFYGFQNTTDADASLGTHRTTASQYGGEVGLDYRPKHGDGAIGIALGMTGNTWDLADQLGKGQATAYQVGTYYSRRFLDTYITAGLSYARYSTTTDRTVNLSGANLYHADFVSNSVSARAEAGHAFHTDIGRITPFANFQADDIGVPHYGEQTVAGSPSYALSYTGKQHYDYASEAGVGWNALIDRLTDIHARVGWLHDYAGGLNDTATFSAFNGASFLVDGASPPKDAGHVVLGISHNESNVVLALNGEAAIAGNSTSYGGTASISYRW